MILKQVNYEKRQALFSDGELDVVVDIESHKIVEDPEALTAAGWLKVSPLLEYPPVWKELAAASSATADVEEEHAPTERKFRVPESVKREARQGLIWAQGFERANATVSLAFATKLIESNFLSQSEIARLHRFFTRIPNRVREASGWDIGQSGYPTNDRIKYTLRGGDSALEWTSKIAKNHVLVASASSDDVDGSLPHKFVPDADTPTECAHCGRPKEHEIHNAVAASAFEYEEAYDYFGRGVDNETTKVDKLYRLAPAGSWSDRQGNEWVNMLEPAEDEILIMLDEESACYLADVLDNSEADAIPVELATINSHEAALYAFAESEIDWEIIDRVFDIYDSQERSINAKVQPRGTGGRFGGGGDAAPAAPSTPKARLPEGMQLVPDVAARIAQYLAENGATAAPEPAETAPESLSVDLLNKLINPFPEAAEFAEPDPNAPRPLYLAIVDAVDTEAVLDLASLTAGPPPSMWRRDKGQWVAAPELLAQMQGSTPPPVVELTDDALVQEVTKQVDAATMDGKPVDQTDEPAPQPTTPVEPDGSSGAKPDANPDQHPVPAQASNLEFWTLDMSASGINEKLFAIPDDRLDVVFGIAQIEASEFASHDLIFLENRRTPKVVPSGKKYEPKPSEGKIVKRRKATAEEEKTIKSGGWVRVNKHGKTPKDSDYKSGSKSKIRPQNNSAEELKATSSDEFKKCPRCGSEMVKDLQGSKQPKCAKCGYHVPLKDSARDNSTFVHPPLEMSGEGVPKATKDKYAKRGYALPDGSFPIPDVAHLKKAIKAIGRAKNQAAAKKHIKKRARALNRVDLLPADWRKDNSLENEYSLFGPNGELKNLTAEGGLDRNRGGAENLRRYWTDGVGGAKIGWNTGGDMTRCMKLLAKYMRGREAGWCALRHKEQTGRWPGEDRGEK